MPGGSDSVLNSSQEAAGKQGTIEVHDDAHALQSMLFHLYNFTYTDASRGEDSVMAFAVKVYAVADKYDVAQLQSTAAQRFKNGCATTDVVDFIKTVYLIDELTNPRDKTLWDIVLPVIKANVTTLLLPPKFQALIFDMKHLNLKLLSLLDDSEKAIGHTSPSYYDMAGAVMYPYDDDHSGNIGWGTVNLGHGRRLY